MADYSSDLSVNLSDGVARLEVHRPPHNYFDQDLLSKIAEAIGNLNNNANCRAMVLAADGRSFCAGADFTGPSPVDAEAVYRAALPIFRRRKPLIAAVQGAAVGGGLGLAVAADFRVATPETRFHANFVRIGLYPGFGLTHTLPRLIGRQAAFSMIMTGRPVKGIDALHLGLADLLVEPTQLKTAAYDFARAIATGAPLAIEAIQWALTSSLADDVEKALAREFAEQKKLFPTEDFQEGVRAVAEKRAPRFMRR